MGWTQIGGNASNLTAIGDTLYCISKTNHAIWRYEGQPNRWSHVVNDVAHLVGNAEAFYYVRASDGTVVQRKTDGSTTDLGGPARGLALAQRLFVVVPRKRELWRWEDEPGHWTIVGDDARSVVASNDALYCVRESDNAALLWHSAPFDWTPLGASVDRLMIGPQGEVYATDHATKRVLAWEGEPGRWRIVGPAAQQVEAYGAHLFCIRPEDASVWECRRDRGEWTQAGHAAAQLATVSHGLVVLNRDNGSIWLRPHPPEEAEKLLDDRRQDETSSLRPVEHSTGVA